MVKSYKELVETFGRKQQVRARRHSAFSLFGGEPPTLYFDDQPFELFDISSSGTAAAAPADGNFVTAPSVNRIGVLRLAQNGQELFLGAARLARADRAGGKLVAGFALSETQFDLVDIQRSNAAATVWSSREIPTTDLLPSENSFLRSDRKVDSWLGDMSVLGPEVDRVAARFAKGDIIAAMADGRDVLLKARADTGPLRWREVVDIVRQHELASYIHLCPLTRRSFSRPRGYPGDAPLLDQIYGVSEAGPWPHPATIAGQVSFFVVHSSACRAVRQRREILAKEIDAICAEKPGEATILSVACGHLREISLSRAAASGKVGKFIALDQDVESLKEVRRSVRGVNLEIVEGSVRALISNKLKFADIDFAYAAGLLDYLVGPVAMRLIERMFGYLSPGGKLLIANFTPSGEDIGYMEAFMDWWLIYRTKEEVAALFANLPQDEIESISIFEDNRGVIAYALVEKKA